MTTRRGAARGALLCVALLAPAACKRDTPVEPTPPASAAPSEAASSPAPLAVAPVEAGAPDASVALEKLAEADAAAYLHAAPEDGKSVGHTSVVFKLSLVGGFEAAFKPRSKRGDVRFKGEIAAYRLARALGLDNVPRAFPRSFRREDLKLALARHPDATELLEKEVVVEKDGTVRGALIPWIHGLEFLPLEGGEWRAKWEKWLSGEVEVPKDQERLAAQISDMIVFDYVTGNWDRWSGGNVGFDRPTSTLLFVDNDGAFYDTPPAPFLAAQLARLEKTRRFSRRFVDALRKLDAAATATALGSEEPTHGEARSEATPLLSARALAGVETRRKRALEIIDAQGGSAAFE